MRCVVASRKAPPHKREGLIAAPPRLSEMSKSWQTAQQVKPLPLVGRDLGRGLCPPSNNNVRAQFHHPVRRQAEVVRRVGGGVGERDVKPVLPVRHAVPAGGALAVDRDGFSGEVTSTLRDHPLIEVRTEELPALPEGITVVATGPLTSPSLSDELKRLTGEEYLYFYDAAAPIVDKDSIDMSKVYLASRYDKGEAAYLNCPMTEEQFDAFHAYDGLRYPLCDGAPRSRSCDRRTACDPRLHAVGIR